MIIISVESFYALFGGKYFLLSFYNFRLQFFKDFKNLCLFNLILMRIIHSLVFAIIKQLFNFIFDLTIFYLWEWNKVRRRYLVKVKSQFLRISQLIKVDVHWRSQWNEKGIFILLKILLGNVFKTLDKVIF